MTKIRLLLLGSMMVSIAATGQKNGAQITKPVIDRKDFGKFSFVSNASVSNDGNICSYSINNPGKGVNANFIQALKTDWKLDIGTASCQFSDDGKYALIKNEHDSLQILNLTTRKSNFISNVANFKHSDQWFAYLLKGSQNVLLRSYESDKADSIAVVNNYYFHNNFLFVERSEKAMHSIECIDLKDKARKTIWTDSDPASKVGTLIFSKNGPHLAFINENKSGKSIWYYLEGAAAATEVANKKTMGI